MRWCPDGDFWQLFCVLCFQRAASEIRWGKTRRRTNYSMKIYMVCPIPSQSTELYLEKSPIGSHPFVIYWLIPMRRDITATTAAPLWWQYKVCSARRYGHHFGIWNLLSWSASRLSDIRPSLSHVCSLFMNKNCRKHKFARPVSQAHITDKAVVGQKLRGQGQ